MELVFSFREGKLVGELRNTTGVVRVTDGPVSYLEVTDGTVKFQSRTGTDYELSMDERGQLKGRTHTRYGSIAEVVLAPALKGTAK